MKSQIWRTIHAHAVYACCPYHGRGGEASMHVPLVFSITHVSSEYERALSLLRRSPSFRIGKVVIKIHMQPLPMRWVFMIFLGIIYSCTSLMYHSRSPTIYSCRPTHHHSPYKWHAREAEKVVMWIDETDRTRRSSLKKVKNGRNHERNNYGLKGYCLNMYFDELPIVKLEPLFDCYHWWILIYIDPRGTEENMFHHLLSESSGRGQP